MALISDTPDPLAFLTGELRNFQEIAKYILPLPGEIPTLSGIEVCGGVIPFNGVCGGDHLIYVDFKKRFDIDARIRQAKEKSRPDIVANLERIRRMAGIVILDVSGHHATDALLAAMLHQAFLLGAIYELDMFGTITKRLFENLNTRFYNSSSLNKFVTMIYGEISEDCTFRFLSAAHPPPVVFSSQHDRFMEVSEDLCTSFPPIGTLPSDNVIDRNRSKSVLGFKNQYELNEWSLMGSGDILLLYTDGFIDHVRNGDAYFPKHLEQKIREVKGGSARQIFEAIRTHFLEFADLSDDASIVVIKRT
ncbi:MAG TPA: PP2C family protein-serine/threonine phosphatase [Terriglobia bacterium]|nr:PP2C family protein-serine/threonine phosphatase [Terriglobia bacterium]